MEAGARTEALPGVADRASAWPVELAEAALDAIDVSL